MAEQPGSEIFALGARGTFRVVLVLLEVVRQRADQLLWALSRLEPKHIILTAPIDGKHAFRRCLEKVRILCLSEVWNRDIEHNAARLQL